MMKKIFYILIVFVLLFSCKKETEQIAIDYGYDYFPMEIGAYIIYKGDSISYNYFFDVNERKRERSFYLKEVTVDTFRDNLNRLAYSIDVYERFDTTSEWRHKVRWYKVIDHKTAERVEDNLRYIKLIFPQRAGDRWNPNKYITEQIPYIIEISPNTNTKSTLSRITEKDVTYASFDSTLTVVSITDTSQTNNHKITEKYARNIGLVYREQWNVVASDTGSNYTLPWIDRARLGFYMKIEAIEYGRQ
jgi:hypothetical protein